MPYVTSVERMAEARGETHGRASTLLEQLGEMFGELPEQHALRVRCFAEKQLQVLARSLLHFQSRDELDRCLEQHADRQPID